MSRTDTFNRADSTSSMNPPSDAGSNWSVLTGTWGITTNRAYVPGGESSALSVLQDGAADVDVQVTLVVAANDEGVVARCDNTNSNLLLWRGNSSNTYDLYKEVSGSFTLLAGGLGSKTNGDVIKLSVSGSTLKGYVNSSLLTTQTDSAGQTNTYHGIRCSSAPGTRFDDFSITDTAAATASPYVPQSLAGPVRLGTPWASLTFAVLPTAGVSTITVSAGGAAPGYGYAAAVGSALASVGAQSAGAGYAAATGTASAAAASQAAGAGYASATVSALAAAAGQSPGAGYAAATVSALASAAGAASGYGYAATGTGTVTVSLGGSAVGASYAAAGAAALAAAAGQSEGAGFAAGAGAGVVSAAASAAGYGFAVMPAVVTNSAAAKFYYLLFLGNDDAAGNPDPY